MKTLSHLSILLICALCALCLQSNAQIIDPKSVLKNKGTDRANSKVDQGVDAGFDKLEEGIGSLLKKKNKAKTTEEASDESEDTEESSDEQPKVSAGGSAQAGKPKLESFTQYDFVPGDQVLYFEDFSQDAIGDFPALWSTNGSGEVKKVNIAEGQWFHMNGEDAVYCYTKPLKLPENFIFEFDIIPDGEYQYGQTITFYEENPEEPKEMNSDLYPGRRGVHITCKKEGWETKGYSNDEAGSDWLTGESSKNPVLLEQVNHVIIWIQKRRVRIYHQGAKVLDMPTNIYAGTVFDRFLFSGWDANSLPMVTNLKFTTATPDTRSKLITEGKLVTYGITFDVNKADIKPESQGTLKSIADVLKENAGVRIKIVGHTDSDGDDALNLDLSKRRAESVKSALATQFGIEATRMETEGAGETKPVAENNTPANKAKNRRVELLKL